MGRRSQACWRQAVERSARPSGVRSGAPGFGPEDQPLWTFTTIHEVVLPALREQGVSESQIETMLVDNPRRLLTPVAIG